MNFVLFILSCFLSVNVEAYSTLNLPEDVLLDMFEHATLKYAFNLYNVSLQQPFSVFTSNFVSTITGYHCPTSKTKTLVNHEIFKDVYICSSFSGDSALLYKVYTIEFSSFSFKYQSVHYTLTSPDISEFYLLEDSNGKFSLTTGYYLSFFKMGQTLPLSHFNLIYSQDDSHFFFHHSDTFVTYERDIADLELIMSNFIKYFPIPISISPNFPYIDNPEPKVPFQANTLKVWVQTGQSYQFASNPSIPISYHIESALKDSLFQHIFDIIYNLLEPLLDLLFSYFEKFLDFILSLIQSPTFVHILEHLSELLLNLIKKILIKFFNHITNFILTLNLKFFITFSFLVYSYFRFRDILITCFFGIILFILQYK